MIRRRPSAAARFLRRGAEVSVSLTGRDFQALKRISRGTPGKQEDRQRLVSMGLVYSRVASRCFLTPLGHKMLERGIETRAAIAIEAATAGETA
jgi:hypothetical protein